MLTLEFSLVIAALLISLTAPSVGVRRLNVLGQAFRALARRRMLAVLLPGLLVIALRLATLPVLPVPVPAIHDEFSYLLAADTFASGRLTNPPHPMWAHFETMHVIQNPTYMSKYPPAQGVAMAIGQAATGAPWAGVLLSAALMCSALCWMLQGWLPPPWALMGGLLAAVRVGALSYWANSYWGGAVAALGGALVLGALPRMLKRGSVRQSLIMGAGLVILANSRPYEGLALGLAAAAVLLAAYLRRRRWLRPGFVAREVAPLALVAVASAVAMGYYNWRVSGHPGRLPYEVHDETYSMAGMFASNGASKQYRHPELREIFTREMYWKQVSETWEGYFRILRKKVAHFWLFFFGPALTLPLLGLPWTLRSPRMRAPLFISTAVLIALATEMWLFPHYAAPMTALIYLLMVQSMRYVRVWRWRGRPSGLFLSRATPAICVALIVPALLAIVSHRNWPLMWPPAWYTEHRGNFERAAVADRLEAAPGRHLVIVRYAPDHDVHREWVYNRADIDGAKVVWARDMGEAANRRLLGYFSDRTVWLMEPDQSPPRLTRYPSGPAVASSPGRKALEP